MINIFNNGKNIFYCLRSRTYIYMTLHDMPKKYRKDTSINIPKSKKKELQQHLNGKPNMSYWVCTAIDEKIEIEKKQLNNGKNN